MSKKSPDDSDKVEDYSLQLSELKTHTLTITRSKENKKEYRLTFYLCQIILQSVGYNKKTSTKFSIDIFNTIISDNQDPKSSRNHCVKKAEFKKLLKEFLKKYPLKLLKNLDTYFFAICRLHLEKEGLIILLGGASGTGKSSLTSLMASRLNLQAFSTDNIRHIMRNFNTKEQSPFIFASTYTADGLVKRDDLSQDERIILGYREQCREVQTQLEKVLDEYNANSKCLIVEGVHLTADFIIKCMKKYRNCFGTMVTISNTKMHARRFISRSDKHSLDPEHNVYVKNIHKIRLIHNDLVNAALKYDIPIIDNKNLDRSVSLVHLCFLKSFKILKHRDSLTKGDKATPLLNEFNSLIEKLKRDENIKETLKRMKMNKGYEEAKQKSRKNKKMERSPMKKDKPKFLKKSEKKLKLHTIKGEDIVFDSLLGLLKIHPIIVIYKPLPEGASLRKYISLLKEEQNIKLNKVTTKTRHFLWSDAIHEDFQDFKEENETISTTNILQDELLSKFLELKIKKNKKVKKKDKAESVSTDIAPGIKSSEISDQSLNFSLIKVDKTKPKIEEEEDKIMEQYDEELEDSEENEDEIFKREDHKGKEILEDIENDDVNDGEEDDEDCKSIDDRSEDEMKYETSHNEYMTSELETTQVEQEDDE